VLTRLNAWPEQAAFDLVVVGAGAAGLAAALFAALDGAQVLLVERTGFVGGSSALSAGTTWVPGSLHAPASDSTAQALGYLDRAVGQHAPRDLREAFLREGPAAIAELATRTEVRFRPCARHPDYLSHLAGATPAGRALEPLPFDGRRLGPLFSLLRPPIPEFTVLGGMMVDRNDIHHLLGMRRSFASLRHSLQILLRHAADRLRHSRGTRLVMGNALVARLLHALARQSGVSLLVETEVTALARSHERVDRVTLQQAGDQRTVLARRGVVLAGGGFNRHPQRRADLLPGAEAAWCPGAPGHTGAAQDLALALGAQLGRGAAAHAYWAPVSLRRRPDGSQAVFPHFVMDRAKPGMLTVGADGRRFVDESTSYHLFGLAMQRPGARQVPAFLICDALALRRYGLGMVRPGGKGLARFLADGYLVQAGSLAELAQRLSLPAPALAETVARLNHFAAIGVDEDFGRGVGDYAHNIGDATAGGLNPNLGPLQTAPFYAVRLFPGDIGAATGLQGDEHARVLDGQGQAIPGLYACGNEMQSVMGGVYTGPGITIGPAIVFARIAARHAMQNRPASAAPKP
jgi:succinate dehydrogenase/fumarate reductase flavoprotein subunit